MPVIRRGEAGDLAQVAAIQDACPAAPHWNAEDYLQYDLLVAVGEASRGEKQVMGFLASRSLIEGGPAGEAEILNLAVAPEFRRQGIADRLCRTFLLGFLGTVFLEVRESNNPARTLYLSLGFVDVTRRPGYYSNPLEAAIVMKFHSC